MSQLVQLPFEYFPDPDRGRPVFNGYVYVGEIDKDPENFPQDVFELQEDGTEVPLSNPFRTSAGGVPVNDQGDVIVVVTSDDYSVRVRRSDGGNPGSVAYEYNANLGNSSTFVEETEVITLTDTQTTVDFTTINCNLSRFYLHGILVDEGRLLETDDYTVTDADTIELTQSYPENTKVEGVQIVSAI